jgi:Arc/MetJ family transcription regulator
MRRISQFAALLVFAGCASTGMGEAECRMADWRAVGFEDGAGGLGPESFGDHRRACADHAVSPSFDAYLAGHARGLEVFCRPQNGARLGASGIRYSGGCPEPLEGPFLAAYTESFGLYERKTTLDGIRQRLRSKRARSQQIERDLVEKTAQLVAPALPAAERAAIGVDLKHLGEERAAVETAIRRLVRERVEAQDEYESYRSAVANRAVD